MNVTARGALGAAVLALAAASPAVAATGGTATARAAAPTAIHLRLHAMPHGSVVFRRGRRHHLLVRVSGYGFTPGSSHGVDLLIPRRHAVIGFSTLRAANSGQVHATLHSRFAGRWPRGSVLIIRMGTGLGRLARTPIAVTPLLRHARHRHHRLIAVEVSARGISYGTPHGTAALIYRPRKHTLTVIVHASGLTPGPHAAHIHLGSCQNQGPVAYMLNDLVANRHGFVRRSVSVFTGVTQPIPASGWYLNIHQGNSRNIVHNGQPTIFFRPLLCANIRRH